MTNLLRADFRRLLKSRAFQISAGLMLLLGIGLPLMHYFMFLDYGQFSFDLYFSDYSVVVIVVLAAFTALFVGTDYSDGTIRNKLIAGHRRSCIYLSNLAVGLFVGLVLCAAYLVPYLIVGLSLLGDMRDDGVNLILISLAMTASFAAIFNLVAMLSSSKARSVVLCFICAIALLYAGVYVSGRLHEPEFYASSAVMGEDGNVVEVYNDPNPNYVTGTHRKVIEVLNDANPGGQAIGVFTMEEGLKPARLALYDLASAVLVTGVGLVLFKRKDLK